MNCTLSSKSLGAWIFCTLTVTKYGNPVFSYLTEIDFGNYYIQEVTIKNTNSPSAVFNASFENQFEGPGDYNVWFRIPSLNYAKFLLMAPIAGICYIITSLLQYKKYQILFFYFRKSECYGLREMSGQYWRTAQSVTCSAQRRQDLCELDLYAL